MVISNEKSKDLKIQRREQILNTSLKLFDEKGYSNTRVSDIAEKVGISKSLVFKYFPKKLIFL